MPPEATRFEVDLPNGTATSVSAAWVSGTRETIILAHGAGAGMDHPFLLGLSSALAAAGHSVLRFVFPYVEQGRRMPGPAPHAIATWRAAVAFATKRAPGAPIWAAGKSYGGRMASMAVAEGLEVAGLIYLGYPLHAPGKPEKPRAEHLPAISVPQLFVEGRNDPFIQPLEQFAQVVADCQDAHVAWIDAGGHSFEVKGKKRPAEEIGADLAPILTAFINQERPGS